MPYIDVHIDVDEFYDQLDRRDKKELVEYLTQDGILEECKVVAFGSTDSQTGSPLDHEWVEMLTKLDAFRYQLTTEQENILRNLINQL